MILFLLLLAHLQQYLPSVLPSGSSPVGPPADLLRPFLFFFCAFRCMIIVDERERKRKNATNTMEHASTGEQGESFPCLLPSSPPSPTSAQFLFGPRFVPFPTNQLVTFFFSLHCSTSRFPHPRWPPGLCSCRRHLIVFPHKNGIFSSFYVHLFSISSPSILFYSCLVSALMFLAPPFFVIASHPSLFFAVPSRDTHF